MKKSLKAMTEHINSLALKTVVLDADDIAGLGDVLRILDAVEEYTAPHGEPFIALVRAMKGYLERVILGEEKDLSPFEEGISLLQEGCRDLGRNKRKGIDVQPLLSRLGETEVGGNPGSSAQVVPEPPAESSSEGPEGATGQSSERNPGKATEKTPEATEEDKQIIREFVTESLESLESIEVRLLDLDQDPKDAEAINAIFRPFHTIKGVSGFLNFTRINRLAHGVENLLDKARNKEMTVDGPIIDLILGSVDTLKKMIRNVEASLDSGTPTEGEVEIRAILENVERLISQVGVTQKPLGEILVQRGSVSQEDLDNALEKQKESREKIGEILIGEDRVETGEVLSALRDQKRASPPPTYQVKVDTQKLDAIVDMVGELAIAQTMLKQNEIIKASADRKLYQITNQLSLIVSGLQSTAMSLRMIPIGSTFQKMLRIVRDLGKKSGKEVRLVFSGEDTEIDRNMVDEIYEPLVHMIRNAIDH
ncbi:MAG: Hpt domain-containing protein, partial [Desulfobacterota bacterium]|nr:Hpt domain-containing protein [Thermodesulfobacteriota bacterium]